MRISEGEFPLGAQPFEQLICVNTRRYELRIMTEHPAENLLTVTVNQYDA
jgi:hypothetical protein